MNRCSALVLAALSASCATWSFPPDPSHEIRRMGPQGSIEVSLGPNGRIDEVEYHLAPALLPAEIRGAADRLIGPGPVRGIEKEIIGGAVHWEVVKTVDGKAWEVLFDPKGRPVTWEIEVDAASVPQAVLATADAFGGPGTRTSHEKILDGAKRLVAYHVKKDAGGKHLKLEIAADGRLLRAWREVTAEIEVPIQGG